MRMISGSSVSDCVAESRRKGQLPRSFFSCTCRDGMRACHRLTRSTRSERRRRTERETVTLCASSSSSSSSSSTSVSVSVTSDQSSVAERENVFQTFQERKVRHIPNLRSDELRHPLDRQNTQLISLLPGIEGVVKAMLSPMSEEVALLENIGTSVLVGEDQLPDIHKLLCDAVSKTTRWIQAACSTSSTSNTQTEREREREERSSSYLGPCLVSLCRHCH